MSVTLGIPRINLVGVSYGESITYKFAHRRPDRVNCFAMAGVVNSLPADVLADRQTSDCILEQGRLDRFVDHIVAATRLLRPDVAIRNRVTARMLGEKILCESTFSEAARHFDIQNRILAPVCRAQDCIVNQPNPNLLDLGSAVSRSDLG